MHSNISVVLPSRHRPEYLTQFVKSYVESTKHLEDNTPDLNIIYHNPKKPSKFNTEIPEGFPLRETFVREDCGLSELWNLSIMLAPTDWVLLTQDDITFNSGWVEYLEKTAASKKYDMIHLFHYAAMCFHKSLICKVGWFDERFNGGGFEDNDYQLRIFEAGLKNRVDQSHDFTHRQGKIDIGHYCNHHKREDWAAGEGWIGNNNFEWVKQKWNPTWNIKNPCYRTQIEVDWHPTYTARYEQKFGPIQWPNIVMESIKKQRELWH